MDVTLTQGAEPMAVVRTAGRYWSRRLQSAVPLSPLRITVAYVLFGTLALFFSDVLLPRYVVEPLLSQLQALKGGAEVVVTAGLVFVLTSGRETQLNRAMDHLDRQREELAVLHRVFRHNLRNDLNVVQGYADRIRERTSSEKLSEECATLLELAEEMTHYTEQANYIKRVSRDDDQRHRYDLAEVVSHLLDDHPLVTADVDVSTTLPERAPVVANPMIRKALTELVTNAIEHNEDEPTLRVDVSPDRGPAHLTEIRIADDGPGIGPEEQQALREGKEEQLVHLSGLGLWFVKWTVDNSDGEFGIETNDLGGTTVIVRIPKTPEMILSPQLHLGGD